LGPSLAHQHSDAQWWREASAKRTADELSKAD
jgi:hypothetical protein